MSAILEARGIYKSFGGLLALSNIDLAIERKKITGIIGPNGAGKTTLFNIFSGFITPDKGKVFYKNQDITKHAAHAIVRLGLARTWQGLRLFENLTVLENVIMGIPDDSIGDSIGSFLTKWSKNKGGLEKAMKLLDLVKMSSKPYNIVKELSYAEQKLVAIGRLMATDAETLLLDEPTSGLDIKTVEMVIIPLIRKLVNEFNKTVCVVEHSIKLVFDLCDIVFCLSDGEMLAFGPPKILRENEELNKAFFQMR